MDLDISPDESLILPSGIAVGEGELVAVRSARLTRIDEPQPEALERCPDWHFPPDEGDFAFHVRLSHKPTDSEPPTT